MPRKARIDAPGALHHVICRGINRRKIFSEKADYTLFTERLSMLLKETQTRCFAWALMTNHFHLLLRTGNVSVSQLMKRLLTYYAVNYNRRHRRVGHLFQNRFKSILCQEGTYLLELVRYIHLNPLRAKIVTDYPALGRHRYCGHGVILGRQKNDWQDTQYVLGLFGSNESNAKRRYREFVRKGIDMGKRPDLTGGGLLRSQGGWAGLKANRRAGDYQKGDERILGDGDFVNEVLAKAQEQMENRYRLAAEGFDFERLLDRVSQLTDLTPEQILDTQRTRVRTNARSILCYWATDQLGLAQSQLSQIFKKTQSAISHAVRRGRDMVEKNGYVMREE
jgi:REP element-mobilizing transposase RayT